MFWDLTSPRDDNEKLASRGNGTTSMRKMKLQSRGRCRISQMPTKSQVISPQL